MLFNANILISFVRCPFGAMMAEPKLPNEQPALSVTEKCKNSLESIIKYYPDT